VTGGLFHVFNHAIGKGVLFLCSGCFLEQTGTRDISALEGIGRKMKLTGLSLSIGLFSLAGIPPFSGFWSKLLIILGGLAMPSDNLLMSITIIVIINSIFSASYYLWLVQRIMVAKPKRGLLKVKEAPAAMIIPIIILAALIIIIGLMPGPILNLIGDVAKTLLGGW
jgi:multicomponent Na+:H+ antiporter subunit D